MNLSRPYGQLLEIRLDSFVLSINDLRMCRDMSRLCGTRSVSFISPTRATGVRFMSMGTNQRLRDRISICCPLVRYTNKPCNDSAACDYNVCTKIENNR